MTLVCGVFIILTAAAVVTTAAPEGTVHTFEVPQNSQVYTYETKWFKQKVSKENKVA